MIPKRSSPQDNLEDITLVKTRYHHEMQSNNSIPEPPPMPPLEDIPEGNGVPTPPPLPPPPPECLNGQIGGSRTNSFTENGQPVGENTPALSPNTTTSVVVKKRGSGGSDEGYLQHRKRGACNETMHVLSSLYAKLLLVATAVLVTTEVLNNPIPLLFYHGYLYTFLLGGGVICLMSIYICLMVDRCPKLTGDDLERGGQVVRKTIYHNPDISIFLRTGMLLFGLGTLITSGLEIAAIFTLSRPCTDEINMAQPILSCLFTFLQMHFLFLNSQEAVRSLGWFRHVSLMHLMSANLAAWIKVVVWETTSEYLGHIHVPHNFSQRWPPKNFNVTTHAMSEDGQHRTFVTANCLWKPVEENMEDLLTLRYCLQNSTIGEIWDMAQPYLSPFTVQYNLIAAAIIYTFWRNADWDPGSSKRYRSSAQDGTDTDKRDSGKKHQKKLDCKGSSKGLFLGLLVLVAGLIILILFFVLSHDHELHFDTLFALITMHTAVLGTSALAVLLGLCQIQRLRFRFRRNRKLSDLVQGSAVLAVFAYGTSSMIVGGTDLFDTNKMVLFVDGALMVFHAALQSLFIRQVIERNYVPGQEGRRQRPGRQVVMYLVFTNIVLWMVELFTAQNHVFSNMQLDFYGKLPWGIFTRTALPLMVFYRFHSSVVLMEAWRRSYRVKYATN